jgi:hypothetical protein
MQVAHRTKDLQPGEQVTIHNLVLSFVSCEKCEVAFTQCAHTHVCTLHVLCVCVCVCVCVYEVNESGKPTFNYSVMTVVRSSALLLGSLHDTPEHSV